ADSISSEWTTESEGENAAPAPQLDSRGLLAEKAKRKRKIRAWRLRHRVRRLTAGDSSSSDSESSGHSSSSTSRGSSSSTSGGEVGSQKRQRQTVLKSWQPQKANGVEVD
ncbi:unnamed protein product, partial [Polarella glacialis]